MQRFDGVICLGGEDWWYHNRGHYDMQMMRELSRRLPVLYVNSIGMRVPRPTEGRMFARRVARKLNSIRRGAVAVRPQFRVYSPFVVPGPRGVRLTRALLPYQIRRVASRMGIRRPLLWIACPPGVEAVDGLSPVGLVYQRTDRYECFTHVDGEMIRGYDRRLKAEADLTVFCSTMLFDEEGSQCRASIYADHGVDFDVFRRAGDGADPPHDVANLPRPRIGFVGGIDAHTFSPDLFVEVARRLADCHFMLVGACSLPEGWCDLPNVTMLGQRPYEEVPGYMAACDVLIMPWNQSEWIQFCNPVKLKEYLAVGRPIVSTPFRELAGYSDLVRTAGDAEGFAAEIRRALSDQPDVDAQRRRVASESWTVRADAVLERLATLGIQPVESEEAEVLTAPASSDVLAGVDR